MSNTRIISNGQAAQDLAQATADFLLSRDLMSRALGMKIVQVGPGRASLTMLVRADMVNGHG